MESLWWMVSEFWGGLKAPFTKDSSSTTKCVEEDAWLKQTVTFTKVNGRMIWLTEMVALLTMKDLHQMVLGSMTYSMDSAKKLGRTVPSSLKANTFRVKSAAEVVMSGPTAASMRVTSRTACSTGTACTISRSPKRHTRVNSLRISLRARAS